MKWEDIRIVYLIAATFFFFALFSDARMLRYIYPNYVGLLTLFSLIYILIRRKKENIVLLIAGTVAFGMVIYQYNTLENPELSSIIHVPLNLVIGTFLLLYAGYETIRNLKYVIHDPQKMKKSRPENLDVYKDETTKPKRKHF